MKSMKPMKPSFLKGDSPDIMKTNMKDLKRQGKSELEATKMSISMARNKMPKAAGHPNRHKNLKAYLHPKKGKKDVTKSDILEFAGDKGSK